MASNRFGTLFCITTWGESHGKAVGVVIDGCPAGIPLSEEDLYEDLCRRAPGRNPYTTSRKEEDRAEIFSGVFEGRATGTPISIVIHNRDVDSSPYHSMKDVHRPGHAGYTYLEKYGIVDYRGGGGRASARETVCRVAAGAVARKVLEEEGIVVDAFLKQLGSVCCSFSEEVREQARRSPIFCPDFTKEKQMIDLVEQVKEEGDSLGGIVSFIAKGLPVGLGDPVYEKLEANLAKGLLSLPASRGFEIGMGFSGVGMRGSEHNDAFIYHEDRVFMDSNRSGGVLGGISTGMPLCGSVAFKPTSSIRKKQQTVDHKGNSMSFNLPEGSRHDPCVAIRAVPVVEAMVSLVLVDALLMSRCVRSFLTGEVL